MILKLLLKIKKKKTYDCIKKIGTEERTVRTGAQGCVGMQEVNEIFI